MAKVKFTIITDLCAPTAPTVSVCLKRKPKIFKFSWLLSLANFIFFFLNDPATTEIYPFPLHDPLPIFYLHHGNRVGHDGVIACHFPQAGRQARGFAGPRTRREGRMDSRGAGRVCRGPDESARWRDRKSTRLNSSHLVISYAVFCLKKKQ